MTGKIGVAISTTGDPHRLGFLETCVAKWLKAEPDYLFVTVDGDEMAYDRVLRVLGEGDVYRVGQPYTVDPYHVMREGRLGVAVNKNTGLEALMDLTDAEHLFLSDDDTWPLNRLALDLHVDSPLSHSMVCWGPHRKPVTHEAYATWHWPRGSVLYQTRAVVEQIGGMDERFGPGGHEHVEYSRRIHQAGLTPAEFCSPIQYAAAARGRALGTGAAAYWHAEDMQRLGESRGTVISRRRRLTSVRRVDGDWAYIEKIMAERDGDTRPVPFRARDNGRSSATLCKNQTA